ncbi:MAG: Flp family type IVb pilin [Pseudomonadota bacterium]
MLVHLLKSLASDDRGAAAVEYGLLLALLALGILGAVTTLGTTLSNGFDNAGSGF